MFTIESIENDKFIGFGFLSKEKNLLKAIKIFKFFFLEFESYSQKKAQNEFKIMKFDMLFKI